MEKTRRRLEPSDAHRIGSVRTLLDVLEGINSKEKSQLFFRGHSNFSYEIKPSIYRDQGWIENEDVLFKELVLRCPNDFAGLESTFQALVKMQHYSLPTRLLDITTNPLIALYFACGQGENKHESGEVVVFNIPTREIKYFDSDTVSVISNISRRPTFSLQYIDRHNGDFNISKIGELLLHEIRKEKPHFKPEIDLRHLESVVCVKPLLNNARIIRQDGAFLLFGIDESKLNHAKIPEDYTPLLRSRRILIKSPDKPRILEQLQRLGITHATIYPEIERVAEYIKSTYSIKAKNLTGGSTRTPT